MKVLIIEDDEHKLFRLRDFVAGELPYAEIREARAYRTGLGGLIQWSPDFVLLDMSMPTFEVTSIEKGGRSRPFGGREILHEMKRRRLLTKAIVVTQFDAFGSGDERQTLSQLRDELSKEYGPWYLGAVYYEPSETAWQRTLRRLLEKAQQKTTSISPAND